MPVILHALGFGPQCGAAELSCARADAIAFVGIEHHLDRLEALLFRVIGREVGVGGGKWRFSNFGTVFHCKPP